MSSKVMLFFGPHSAAIAMQVVPAPVDTADDLQTRNEGLARTPGTGLLIGPDATNIVNIRKIAQLAAANRLPGISVYRQFAVEGGLIEDVFEPSEMERRFGRHDRFDAVSLQALLESEGFLPFATGTYFVKPFTHAQMDVVLESPAFDRASLLRGFDGMIKHMPDLGCELVELDDRRGRAFLHGGAGVDLEGLPLAVLAAIGG